MRQTEGYEWLRSNPERFSVFGVRGRNRWEAGASTPMVLASAQKLFVLRALSDEVAHDPELLNRKILIGTLSAFVRPGTDGGAHERSLMADGIDPSNANAETTVRRLIVFMMHYSSNAAADALSEIVETSRAARIASPVGDPPLLPRICTQIDDVAQHGAAGWHRSTTQELVSSIKSMASPRPTGEVFDPLAFVPRLRSLNGVVVRAKKGHVQGFRAAGLLWRPDGKEPLFAAYAFETPQRAPELELEVEQMLLKIALRNGAEDETPSVR